MILELKVGAMVASSVGGHVRALGLGLSQLSGVDRLQDEGVHCMLLVERAYGVLLLLLLWGGER